MREGSLEAPTRHPIAWQDPDFYDRGEDRGGDAPRLRHLPWLPALLQSLRHLPAAVRPDRQHRRRGELDGVDAKDYGKVVDACTLCDMCFMTKCPYVPPHRFNLDFPHLMLRHRAAEAKAGKTPCTRAPARRDRPQRQARRRSRAARQLGDATRDNKLTRPVMEKVAGIDRDAALPKFHGRTFVMRAKARRVAGQRKAPGFGRKAVLYATCFVNYNNPAHRRGDARGAGAERRRDRSASIPAAAACRCWSRAISPRSRPSARKVAAELAAADRRGLRHRRAGAVLRADAEIRMAADPARRSRRSSASPAPPSTSANMSSTSPRRRAWRRA